MCCRARDQLGSNSTSLFVYEAFTNRKGNSNEKYKQSDSRFARLGSAPVYGQVHKYFTPGTVWGVTTIKIHPGMDQAYLEYLDTQLKKESDIPSRMAS